MVALGVSKTIETTAKEVHYDTLKSRTPSPAGLKIIYRLMEVFCLWPNVM